MRKEMNFKKVDFKILSSLEKCFLDDDISEKQEIQRASIFKNEKISFQLAYTTNESIEDTTFISLDIEGELKGCLSIKRVMNVPCVYPTYTNRSDDYYLRKTPGLYPDLLLPISYNGKINLVQDSLLSLWVDLELNDNIKAGEYTLKFILKDNNDNWLSEKEITIEVINALLPELSVSHTEWFHCDCLSEYYNVEMFSEDHWKIIKHFIKTAAENEINVIMIPIFTPALDTFVGGERKTCQLVDIFIEDGKYRFDFSKVERWVKMCLELGIDKFEFPPLFTQWGAENSPKIMAYENGDYKRIFGWETDAHSSEYIDFLGALIPETLKEIHKLGIKPENCFFHISDEPDAKDIEMYKITLDMVRHMLDGYTVIDAVWNVELYKEGLLSTPVISIGAVENFKKIGAENYWVYYCGGHYKDVSNRYISMPLSRTRILGVQMYKDGAVGFLHWGYNYYHNRYSYNTVNPYLETCAEYFAPGGDAFIVYPGENGKPCDSIRLKAMRDAMQDIRVLKLCEELYGREYVIGLIQEGLDYELDYKNYPHNDFYITELRNKLNKAIAEKIN